MAGANRKRIARHSIFDPTRLRVIVPLFGSLWVLGKLFGWTMTADTLLFVVILMTWGWVKDIADRLESLEAEIDAKAEEERLERLASDGRDELGRFSKQSPV